MLTEVNLGMQRGTKPMDRDAISEFKQEEVKQYRKRRYLLLVHRLNWYSKGFHQWERLWAPLLGGSVITMRKRRLERRLSS